MMRVRYGPNPNKVEDAKFWAVVRGSRFSLSSPFKLLGAVTHERILPRDRRPITQLVQNSAPFSRFIWKMVGSRHL